MDVTGRMRPGRSENRSTSRARSESTEQRGCCWLQHARSDVGWWCGGTDEWRRGRKRKFRLGWLSSRAIAGSQHLFCSSEPCRSMQPIASPECTALKVLMLPSPRDSSIATSPACSGVSPAARRSKAAKSRSAPARRGRHAHVGRTWLLADRSLCLRVVANGPVLVGSPMYLCSNMAGVRHDLHWNIVHVR